LVLTMATDTSWPDEARTV